MEAGAETLFEQRPYTEAAFALLSSIDGQQMADDFSPTATWHVTGVNWFGRFEHIDASTPHRFRIGFHTAISSGIASAPFQQFTVTPVRSAGFNPPGAAAHVSSFAAVIPPVALEANQRVWLSIVDLDPVQLEPPLGSRFVWQESSVARLEGDWGTRGSEGADWVVSNGGNLAFRLEGVVVPEPETMTLLMLGAVLTVVFVRRRPAEKA